MRRVVVMGSVSVVDSCCASDDVVINSVDACGDDSVRRCHGVTEWRILIVRL